MSRNKFDAPDETSIDITHFIEMLVFLLSS